MTLDPRSDFSNKGTTMKVRIIAVAVLWAATSAAFAAEGMVKPTGITPQFPKAYKELANQTKPPSNNWLLDANDDAERFRRLQVVLGEPISRCGN